MSHRYTKANPNCIDCDGTGRIKRKRCVPPLFGTGLDTETVIVRCRCTDGGILREERESEDEQDK